MEAVTDNTHKMKDAIQARIASIRTKKGSIKPALKKRNQVPQDILEDPKLQQAMKDLPSNYDFQLAKTIWRLQDTGAKKVALQMPEGLLMFACILADIFEQVADIEEVVVLGDVTYGACCIDDFGAKALGCDFLIHYGHSCLVPVDVTSRQDRSGEGKPLKVMYVFVDISIDVDHFTKSVKLTFKTKPKKIYLLSTIQFVKCLNRAKEILQAEYGNVQIPQAMPLSRGEVLGCTSPTLEADEKTVMLFVADGRFHMESTMIANPTLAAYRYNPYDKTLTKESYHTEYMRKVRYESIKQARTSRRWGIIMGTLGRQGNPEIVSRLQNLLKKHSKDTLLILLSEAFPAKLRALDNEVETWVQVACPRLSIDWGHSFTKPLLTPYEAFVALGEAEWSHIYPQDYYAKGSGPWTNYYGR